jgi:plasmid replication initiation protein
MIEESKVVYQSNAMTSARFDYSSNQLDILFILLSSLKKDDQEDKAYKIHIGDIQLLTGKEWQYAQLSATVKEMGTRNFFIQTKRGWKQIFPFDSVDYVEGAGTVEIKLGRTARGYFFDLKQYSVMQLRALFSCTSKYSKRIYAFCCQWKNAKKPGERSAYKELPIAILKEMLFLKDPKDKEPEQFTSITTFREKVLDVAMLQINQHSDLIVSYELLKTGRSFTGIKFCISIKKVIQPEIDFSIPIEIQLDAATRLKNFKNIRAYGIPDELANQVLDHNKHHEFEALINELQKSFIKSNKMPENQTGYLITAMRNKGIIK